MKIVWKMDVAQITPEYATTGDNDQIITHASDNGQEGLVTVTTLLVDHPASHVTVAHLTIEEAQSLADALQIVIRAARDLTQDYIDVNADAEQDDPLLPCVHPEVYVKLAGEDGNALSIVSRVAYAMRAQGVGKVEIDKYRDEALSGDYDNVLQTTMRWVNVL